jgi:hypothetical protein
MKTFLACCMSLTLATVLQAAPQGQAHTFRAWIDGRSRLTLDDATARWDHFDFAAPGRLECNIGAMIEPTTIDGFDWFPVWPDVPDCENRDCGCGSDSYLGLQPPIPDAELFVSLIVIAARGPVTLVEVPQAANGYRVVIEFDDNALGGADWYEIALELGDCGQQKHCTSSPNSTGQPALISASGSLSVTAGDTVLDVVGAPPGNIGQFFYGQDPFQLPFANGTLCVSPFAPGLFRLAPAVAVSPTGEAHYLLDFPALPLEGQILGGSSWSFQFWFRDPAAGGAGANLSDAVRVTFCI